jgi:hypothetical protein
MTTHSTDFSEKPARSPRCSPASVRALFPAASRLTRAGLYYPEHERADLVYGLGLAAHARDYAPPLKLADQADEPPPLGRLVGYRQGRDQQLVDFGRQYVAQAGGHGRLITRHDQHCSQPRGRFLVRPV